MMRYCLALFVGVMLLVSDIGGCRIRRRAATTAARQARGTATERKPSPLGTAAQANPTLLGC
jgi:hypothetical protein